MIHFRTLFIKSLLLLWMAGMVLSPAHGLQEKDLRLENPQIVYRFGETITFGATVRASQPITHISLVFKSNAEEITRVESIELDGSGAFNVTYDASQNVIPPFSEITFWVQAVFADGKTYTSNPGTFNYIDNRFPWISVTRANVHVNWYAGDEAFGAAALDAAGAGLLSISEFLPLTFDQPIYIYIYANPADMQAALTLGGQDWVGGHATSEIGLVLVSISPDSSYTSIMQNKIPHELTHLVFYRTLGEKYKYQPVWFVEGMASMMEKNPSPDYEQALQLAGDNQTLIPFTELCASFPLDSGGAYLSYAQSRSFVEYIKRTQGISGILRMMAKYSDGLDCDLGTLSAIGISLPQLDSRWREEALGQNPTGAALRSLSPFLLILALVLLVPLWGTIDLLQQRRKRHAAKSKSK